MSNDTKKTLARNLRSLMEGTPSLDSYPKIAKATRLGVGTISRILNAESAASIDTVAVLAKAFGHSPAELLRADFDSKRSSLVAVAERLDQLPTSQQAHIIAVMSLLLDQAEGHQNDGTQTTTSFTTVIEPNGGPNKKHA